MQQLRSLDLHCAGSSSSSVYFPFIRSFNLSASHDIIIVRDYLLILYVGNYKVNCLAMKQAHKQYWPKHSSHSDSRTFTIEFEAH